MVSAFHVQFGGVSTIFEEIIGEDLGDLGKPEAGEEINLLSKERDDQDIYGEKRLATLSSKELELQINPIAGEIDINIITEVTQQDFVAPQFPKEIYTSADVSYQGRIPQKNQQVVKNYFNAITQ